jgi:hypothetical protein
MLLRTDAETAEALTNLGVKTKMCSAISFRQFHGFDDCLMPKAELIALYRRPLGLSAPSSATAISRRAPHLSAFIERKVNEVWDCGFATVTNVLIRNAYSISRRCCSCQIEATARTNKPTSVRHSSSFPNRSRRSLIWERQGSIIHYY